MYAHHSAAASPTKEEYLIGFTNKISLISANEAQSILVRYKPLMFEKHVPRNSSVHVRIGVKTSNRS